MGEGCIVVGIIRLEPACFLGLEFPNKDLKQPYKQNERKKKKKKKKKTKEEEEEDRSDFSRINRGDIFTCITAGCAVGPIFSRPLKYSRQKNKPLNLI